MPAGHPSPPERLRVMRVIARMNVGGPALQVTGLVQEMDSQRFDHRLYSGLTAQDEADYVALRAPGLPLTYVRGLGRAPDPLDDLRALRELHAQMRRFRPHIVHTHTAKAGFLGRAAAKAAGVPALVHTFHGHLLHGYFSPALTRAVVLAERTLARGSSRLVAVGNQVRDDLLAAGIGRPGQYSVFPPGIALPPPPPREQARAELGLPASGAVVVFVARLTGIKQPHRFLQVARLLADRHPDTTFAVCGEGDLLEALRASASSNVVFLGWRGDVERVYSASDLVVLTSDNEGMPVSLIEAGLCGVPAVSTRVGSVEEVVLHERSGILCSTEVAEIAEAVSQLLSDDARRSAYGAAAQQHCSGAYGRSRLVADTEALYEDLAAEKGLLAS